MQVLHKTLQSRCRSMEEFKKMLPSRFVQINRSKIINLDKVIRLDIKTRMVTLTDSSKHSVAARRIKDVLDAFS